MKLGHIFLSLDSWKKVSELPLEPKTAYKIHKYLKQLLVEYEIVDKQRIAIIHEVTGTEPGSIVQIEPGSEQYVQYWQKFNEVLSVESDVSQLDMPIEMILESSGKLSVKDISALEPFFS